MSNQLNQEEFKKRAELLKRAKQILVQEYTAMRSIHHRQWLRDSEASWKTRGVLIAYPTAKLFPSEQEIVDKALELYNRSMQQVTPLVDSPTVPVQDAQPEVQPTFTISAYDAEPVSITEQLQAAYNTPTLPTIANVAQANGDFVIIHEPIELEDPTPVTEPIIEEPTVEEPTVEEVKIEEPVTETEESTVKHSLLRNVLTGWLSKNKDKDKP